MQKNMTYIEFVRYTKPQALAAETNDTTPSVTNTYTHVLLDFWLTVKAATLISISGCGSAISSAKEGKSGFIYNLVKS